MPDGSNPLSGSMLKTAHNAKDKYHKYRTQSPTGAQDLGRGRGMTLRLDDWKPAQSFQEPG